MNQGGIILENKKKETAVVASQRKLATGIYDMWINTTLASQAKAGQFINIYPEDKSTLLPRPISICEADKEAGKLRIVYRVAGKGTGEFSTYSEGHNIDILGTLGNGFPIDKANGKRVFLMGGGIGIPPMLELAKQIKAAGVAKQIDIIVGYRNNELFLSDDLSKYGTVHIATEDGSAGTKGNVMNAIEAESLEGDVIFACGPMPMLRAIKAYAADKGMQAYISLEERMACGVGACLGCVVKTKEIDHHSHVKNARICTDGPVYEAQSVEI
jgi:dihydroorotate dehydrogenase electron transfer subunit